MNATAQTAWTNKTALVCGASAGLGLQLATTLLRQGAKVVMIGRDASRLNEAKLKIAQQVAVHNSDKQAMNYQVTDELLARLIVISGDMCDKASTSRIAEQIRQQVQQLDLVINAVGESDRGSIEKLSCERMLDLVRTNVGSGLNAIQCFTPMLKPTGGVLVLIGSLSSHFAPRYLGGYSIAKHGLAALAQQARLELAESGVHVTLVSPGPIARADAGTRYNQTPEAADLPAAALKSGGGAKVKGLDPTKLAEAILLSAAQRRTTVILPRKARLLLLVSALSQRLGEYLLRKFTA